MIAPQRLAAECLGCVHWVPNVGSGLIHLTKGQTAFQPPTLACRGTLLLQTLYQTSCSPGSWPWQHSRALMAKTLSGLVTVKPYFVAELPRAPAGELKPAYQGRSDPGTECRRCAEVTCVCKRWRRVYLQQAFTQRSLHLEAANLLDDAAQQAAAARLAPFASCCCLEGWGAHTPSTLPGLWADLQPQVRHLACRGGWPFASASELAGWPRLQTLSASCPPSAVPLAVLAAPSPLPLLKLEDVPWDWFSHGAAAAASELTALSQLLFNSTELEAGEANAAEWTAVCSALAALPRLRALTLSVHCPVRQQGCVPARLRAVTQLQHLELRVSGRCSSELLFLPGLCNLQLTCAQWGGGPASYGALWRAAHLTSLSICSLAPLQAPPLVDLPHLLQLHLQYAVQDGFLEALLRPGALPHLQHLTMAKICLARADASGTLSLLGSLPELHTLHLTDAGLPRVPPALLSLHRLQDLRLSGNCIQQLPLVPAGGFPELTRLVLTLNYLTHASLTALAEATALQELNLSRNRIVQLQVASGPWPPALTALDLSQNQLSALPLADLQGASALRSLRLDGNNQLERLFGGGGGAWPPQLSRLLLSVSALGCLQLSALRCAGALREVVFSQVSIGMAASPADVASLLDHLPEGCRVRLPSCGCDGQYLQAAGARASCLDITGAEELRLVPQALSFFTARDLDLC